MSNTEHFYFALEWLLRRSLLGLEPRILQWAEANGDLLDKILCERKHLPVSLIPLWSIYNLHPHTDATAAAMCRGILARYAQALNNLADVQEPRIPALLMGQITWTEDHESLGLEMQRCAMTFRARNFIYTLVRQACLTEQGLQSGPPGV